MTASLYHPGRGYLYQQDARAKLVGTILATAALFFPLPLSIHGAVACLLLAISFHATGIRSTGAILRPLLVVCTSILLFSPLYERSGQAVLTIGTSVMVTAEGLERAGILCTRFISVSLLWGLMLRTTRPEMLLCALQFFRLPYRASLVISLVFRFIPYFARTYAQIREAQQLRLPAPVQRQKRGLHRHMTDMLPTLTSTLVSSVRMIPTLAMSLEHRGVGRSGKRTSYYSFTQKNEQKAGQRVRVFTDFLISIIMPVILTILSYCS